MSFHNCDFLIGIGIDDDGTTLTQSVIRRTPGRGSGWPGGAVVTLERLKAPADLVPAIDRYFPKIDRGDEWDRSAAFVFDCTSFVHGRALLEAWNRCRTRRLGIPADFLAVTQEENRSRVRGIGRVPWGQLLEVLALLRRRDSLKVAALPLAAELEQQIAGSRQRPLRADQDGYSGTDLFRVVALSAFRAHVGAASTGGVIEVRWTAPAGSAA